jgi:hypothetical protein
VSGLTHFQAVVGGLAAATASAAGAWASARKLVKYMKPFRDFLTDWNGEPARPGVARRPPVMERLRNLDDGQLHIIDRLVRVEAAQLPNGGGTMRDEIREIKDAVVPRQ